MEEGELSKIQKKSKSQEIFRAFGLAKSLSFVSQPQTTLTKFDYAALKNHNLGPENQRIVTHV